MTELCGPIQRFTGVLGMAEDAAPVQELVDQLRATHTVARDDLGQIRYHFPVRGIEMVFWEGAVCEVLAHTRAADDGSHACFPIPPINDLSAQASREEVTEHLGAPVRVDADRLSYRITDGWLRFRVGEDGHVTAVSVSTLDQPRPVAEDDDPDNEPLVFTGHHSRSADQEQVTFTDEDAELSFSRRLDATGPLVIGWEGRHAQGGLVSLTLQDGNTLVVQVSAEAATTLGLFERSSFQLSDDCHAGQLCEIVNRMASAEAGTEAPHARRASGEPPAAGDGGRAHRGDDTRIA